MNKYMHWLILLDAKTPADTRRKYDKLWRYSSETIISRR